MKIDNHEEFERLVTEARAQPFTGWDFSWIADRWQTENPPWDYDQSVRHAIASADSLLDMGTGGGEKLARMAPLPPRTFATEAYPPNVPIAIAQLSPIGVKVVSVDDHSRLPFANCQFDVVANRHEEFYPSEVARILKPGGRFITQQVGEKNNHELTDWLRGEAEEFDFTLKRSSRELLSAGLVVVDRKENFARTEFYDVGAIIYYLRVVSWQVLGFTVDGYRDRLAAIHNHIQRHGSFVASSHRCYIEAVKPHFTPT